MPNEGARPDADPIAAVSREAETTSGESLPSDTVTISAGEYTTGTSKMWGPFQLLRRIGAGGFGEVFRAWDAQLEREVALKLLKPERINSDQSAVLREARMMARVRHENIVPIYGVDSHDGRVGFWSELINGETIASMVRRKGRIPVPDAARLGVELCKAVGAVHAAGLLHRDIKAENAMVDSNGRVLLMDFGLTYESGERGVLGGTPQYMAPELLRGDSPTVASDIYALGVLLHFLVTGTFPARDTGIGHIQVPGGFKRILQRAVATDPAVRLPSADQVAAELAPFASKQSTAPASRRTWIAAGIGAAAITAVLAVPSVRQWAEAARNGTAPTVYNTYLEGQSLLYRFDKPGNVAKAISVFQKTIKADPAFALAHAGLAEAYQEQYRTSRDTALFDKAIASCNAALALDKQIAPVYVTLGKLHNASGQKDLAMQDFTQALALNKRNADAYRVLGLMYQDEGFDVKAAEAFQKAIDLKPDDWRGYNGLGYFYVRRGKYPEAIAQYQKMLALTPDNATAMSNLGSVYFRQNRFGDAESEFRRAVALAPSYLVYSNLGSVLLLESRFAEAAEMFRKAVELNPSNYVTWGNLAAAYRWSPSGGERARETYQKAIHVAEESRKKNPDDARLLANLGSYHAVLGNREDSLKCIRQALALAPDDVDIMFRAGEAFELLGMRIDALKQIGDALGKGYPAEYVKRSPELAALRSDPRFK